MSDCDKLVALYDRLLNAYGRQNWWPAESVLEVIVGAVLTQNTSWKNVDKAMTSLKNAGKLELDYIKERCTNSGDCRHCAVEAPI